MAMATDGESYSASGSYSTNRRTRANTSGRDLFATADAITLTTVTKVKESRRRGASRISSKNQITIPAEALRGAGLAVGDRVVAHADGAGRVILERERDVIAEFAGALTGTYRPDELDELRSEWD